jgi:DNA polymerase III alpha subunit
MAIGNFLTDGKYNGDTWRRLLKKLSKASKAPEDLEKWKKMVACAKEVGVKKGISNKDIELLCDDLLTLSQYSFNKSHSAAYSYLAMEEVYLAKYFKPYFYAVNLSNEAGKKDAIVEAIEACRYSGYEAMPPDINNSKENFFPKDNKLYFGFNNIKGVGEEPAKSIVEHQPYTSVIDFICKNIDTKINKRVTLALIGSGAFDNLIDGNRKYYQLVAERFYEKKKTTKTIPLLVEKWEDTLKEIEACETKPEDYIELENTYLGGNFFHNIFSVISDKIEALYRKGYCLRDFKEIREKNLPKQYCFVHLNSLRNHIDKNNNEMLFCEIEDRNGEKQSVPIFASFYKYCKEKIDGEGFYLMDLYPTEDGKIMFGSRTWVKNPTTIKNMLAKVKN